jgi:hypothetical protein
MPHDPNSFVDIPFDALREMLDGTSAIDTARLLVTSHDDAESFLQSYGFAWNHPEHRAALLELRNEAIEFIVGELLVGEARLVMDADVAAERDIRKLLIWASDFRSPSRQLWACSLLRVMHTFAHCGSSFQQQYDTEIRALQGAPARDTRWLGTRQRRTRDPARCLHGPGQKVEVVACDEAAPEGGERRRRRLRLGRAPVRDP